MTVLFYLNNVTGGGETVFPVADNRTYDEMVRASGAVTQWDGRALGKCGTFVPAWVWDEGPGGPLGTSD